MLKVLKHFTAYICRKYTYPCAGVKFALFGTDKHWLYW